MASFLFFLSSSSPQTDRYLKVRFAFLICFLLSFILHSNSFRDLTADGYVGSLYVGDCMYVRACKVMFVVVSTHVRLDVCVFIVHA
jgi:hypothetical protein